jgi:uncharacterized protein YidB (DUF937 family)
MSGLDDLLGGLLGGKGGAGGADLGSIGDILGQLSGQARGGSSGLGGGGGLLAALLPLLSGLLANGGLGRILSGFQQQGLGAEADSWVGTGANEPVTGAQVEGVIGSDEIARIAEQLGVSPQEAADAIAEVLPQMVDKVSPQGELPAETDLDSLFATIQAAGGPSS